MKDSRKHTAELVIIPTTIRLLKEMEELQELILAEAPESIWYDGQDCLWYVDTEWLVRGGVNYLKV